MKFVEVGIIIIEILTNKVAYGIKILYKDTLTTQIKAGIILHLFQDELQHSKFTNSQLSRLHDLSFIIFNIDYGSIIQKKDH